MYGIGEYNVILRWEIFPYICMSVYLYVYLFIVDHHQSSSAISR